MEIISLNFALFTLIVLGIYYLFPRRIQNIWLLLSSYAFYLTFGKRFLLVLILTTAWNYFIALRIRSKNNPPNRFWLWLGIGSNLLAFAFFRLESSGYFQGFFEYLFNIGRTNLLRFVLPIGFSFYILQAISYLIDVYRKQTEASRDIIEFALYMAYFPKLLAGPIERARSFLPKLSQNRLVDNTALSRAFSLLLIGLIRKVLIADILSQVIPMDLFSSPANYSGIELIGYMGIYAFWLYNDFAGYTGIVRGISAFFSIELSANFQQPYFARNFSDFWNRWHISLSHWLRDYIYYPISRWLRKRYPSNLMVNIVVPPMLTMLASGAWHNFGAYMLVWGGLHGIYQVGERLVQQVFPKWWAAGENTPWRRTANTLSVFIFTVIAWTAFGSGSFRRTISYWQSLWSNLFLNPSFTFAEFLLPICLILGSLVIDYIQWHANDELIFMKYPRPVQIVLLVGIMVAFFLNFTLGKTVVTAFIYQGF